MNVLYITKYFTSTKRPHFSQACNSGQDIAAKLTGQGIAAKLCHSEQSEESAVAASVDAFVQ
jgi:hypothetical protein